MKINSVDSVHIFHFVKIFYDSRNFVSHKDGLRRGLGRVCRGGTAPAGVAPATRRLDGDDFRSASGFKFKSSINSIVTAQLLTFYPHHA
jgi:hypothetical protein